MKQPERRGVGPLSPCWWVGIMILQIVFVFDFFLLTVVPSCSLYCWEGTVLGSAEDTARGHAPEPCSSPGCLTAGEGSLRRVCSCNAAVSLMYSISNITAFHATSLPCILLLILIGSIWKSIFPTVEPRAPLGSCDHAFALFHPAPVH